MPEEKHRQSWVKGVIDEETSAVKKKSSTLHWDKKKNILSAHQESVRPFSLQNEGYKIIDSFQTPSFEKTAIGQSTKSRLCRKVFLQIQPSTLCSYGQDKLGYCSKWQQISASSMMLILHACKVKSCGVIVAGTHFK